MKVLHVIPSLSPREGGPTQALVSIERALASRGVDVQSTATDDDGPGRTNGKPLGQALAENGSMRWYFAKQTDFYKWAPSFSVWIARKVGDYDLLHIHALFSFMPVVAARVARRKGVPYVIRPLGTLNRYGLGERRRWLKAMSMKFIEAPILHGAAAIHFTSEAEAAQARGLGIGFKEAIIPLAVEPARAAPSHPQCAGLRAAPTLLFLSRLDPKKNLEGLLCAMALLKAEVPSLQLLVAGDGAPAYVASLKALAVSLGISDQVTWAGYVEGEAKAAAFEAATIFVLPSFSENFGIAAAEALAAGLPCVLGKGVAIANEVTHAQAGFAVNPDARSISDALRRIITDKEELAVMSLNARQLALERFSLEAMGAGLEQLYTSILNR
jgi:glycosyltransferase involved in cell wall biosynthesis